MCRDLACISGHAACSAEHSSHRRSAIDRRTTRHPGYALSQRLRKRVEEIFGWLKSVGGFRRTRYRGLARTQLAGYLVAAAYNLVRMARLVDSRRLRSSSPQTLQGSPTPGSINDFPTVSGHQAPLT